MEANNCVKPVLGLTPDDVDDEEHFYFTNNILKSSLGIFIYLYFIPIHEEFIVKFLTIFYFRILID